MRYKFAATTREAWPPTRVQAQPTIVAAAKEEFGFEDEEEAQLPATQGFSFASNPRPLHQPYEEPGLQAPKPLRKDNPIYNSNEDLRHSTEATYDNSAPTHYQAPPPQPGLPTQDRQFITNPNMTVNSSPSKKPLTQAESDRFYQQKYLEFTAWAKKTFYPVQREKLHFSSDEQQMIGLTFHNFQEYPTELVKGLLYNVCRADTSQDQRNAAANTAYQVTRILYESGTHPSFFKEEPLQSFVSFHTFGSYDTCPYTLKSSTPWKKRACPSLFGKPYFPHPPEFRPETQGLLEREKGFWKTVSRALDTSQSYVPLLSTTDGLARHKAFETLTAGINAYAQLSEYGTDQERFGYFFVKHHPTIEKYKQLTPSQVVSLMQVPDQHVDALAQDLATLPTHLHATLLNCVQNHPQIFQDYQTTPNKPQFLQNIQALFNSLSAAGFPETHLSTNTPKRTQLLPELQTQPQHLHATLIKCALKCPNLYADYTQAPNKPQFLTNVSYLFNALAALQLPESHFEGDMDKLRKFLPDLGTLPTAQHKDLLVCATKHPNLFEEYTKSPNKAEFLTSIQLLFAALRAMNLPENHFETKPEEERTTVYSSINQINPNQYKTLVLCATKCPNLLKDYSRSPNKALFLETTQYLFTALTVINLPENHFETKSEEERTTVYSSIHQINPNQYKTLVLCATKCPNLLKDYSRSPNKAFFLETTQCLFTALTGINLPENHFETKPEEERTTVYSSINQINPNQYKTLVLCATKCPNLLKDYSRSPNKALFLETTQYLFTALTIINLRENHFEEDMDKLRKFFPDLATLPTKNHKTLITCALKHPNLFEEYTRSKHKDRLLTNIQHLFTALRKINLPESHFEGEIPKLRKFLPDLETLPIELHATLLTCATMYPNLFEEYCRSQNKTQFLANIQQLFETLKTMNLPENYLEASQEKTRNILEMMQAFPTGTIPTDVLRYIIQSSDIFGEFLAAENKEIFLRGMACLAEALKSLGLKENYFQHEKQRVRKMLPELTTVPPDKRSHFVHFQTVAYYLQVSLPETIPTARILSTPKETLYTLCKTHYSSSPITPEQIQIALGTPPRHLEQLSRFKDKELLFYVLNKTKDLSSSVKEDLLEKTQTLYSETDKEGFRQLIDTVTKSPTLVPELLKYYNPKLFKNLELLSFVIDNLEKLQAPQRALILRIAQLEDFSQEKEEYLKNISIVTTLDDKTSTHLMECLMEIGKKRQYSLFLEGLSSIHRYDQEVRQLSHAIKLQTNFQNTAYPILANNLGIDPKTLEQTDFNDLAKKTPERIRAQEQYLAQQLEIQKRTTEAFSKLHKEYLETPERITISEFVRAYTGYQLVSEAGPVQLEWGYTTRTEVHNPRLHELEEKLDNFIRSNYSFVTGLFYSKRSPGLPILISKSEIESRSLDHRDPSYSGHSYYY